MPLSDWINLNPAPEATGDATGTGQISGGYWDPQAATSPANYAFSFYNQANPSQASVEQGIASPFEQYQQYQQSLQPGNVSTIQANRPDSAVSVNPAVASILGQSNITATGQPASALPANIFAGPVPLTGLYGAAGNALYNIGSGAFNYLNNLGTNQISLADLQAGNVGIETGYNPNYPNYLQNVSTVNSDAARQAEAQAVIDRNTALALGAQYADQAKSSENTSALVDQAIANYNAANAANAAASSGQSLGTSTAGSDIVGMNPYEVPATYYRGGETSYIGGPSSFGTISDLGADTLRLDPFNVNAATFNPSLSPTPTISPTSPTPEIITQPPVSVVTNRETTPTITVSLTPNTPTISRTPEIVTQPPFTVVTNRETSPTVTVSLTPSTPTISLTPEIITEPPFTVVTNRPTVTISPTNIFTPTISLTPEIVTLPPFTVVTEPPPTITVSISVPPTATISPSNIFTPSAPPPTPTPTPPATTPQVSVTTPVITPTQEISMPPGTPGTPGTPTITGMPTERNFESELTSSLDTLSGKQQQLLDYYNKIYQQFMPETLKTASSTSLAQLAADQAKLQRIQSGQLNAEDVRQAQQGAREAYAARGQLMGPGAVSAEILNREAIRQQRENEARAGYNTSVQNVLNTANLQTGNIFNPISSLISNTFNPLGQYPQDVYNTNFNAQVAKAISDANNAAAIEAAKYGATAQQKAAYISAMAAALGKADWKSIFGL